MELDISSKFGSRFGVVILVFIFFTSGYARPQKTQSIQPLPGSSPSPTSTVEIMAMENVLLEPSPDFTIQPSNPLDTTIVPSEIVQEMLGQIHKEEAVLALRYELMLDFNGYNPYTDFGHDELAAAWWYGWDTSKEEAIKSLPTDKTVYLSLFKFA